MSVGINVTYWIHQEDKETETYTKEFDASLEQESRIGLPVGTVPKKPNPGDYAYSGIHDHGELPALKENGDLSKLLTCANKAKEFNDTYLTEIIKRNQAKTNKPPTKKPKI